MSDLLLAQQPVSGGTPVIEDWVPAVALAVLGLTVLVGIVLALRQARHRGKGAGATGGATRRQVTLLVAVAVGAWLVVGFTRGPGLAVAAFEAGATDPVYDAGTRPFPAVPPLFIVEVVDEVRDGPRFWHTSTQTFLVEPISGWTVALSKPMNGVDDCDTPGCPVYVATHDHAAAVCALVRVSGVLVPDATYGTGLRQADGAVLGVVWPFGWSAMRGPDGIVVLDRDGHVMAREGEDVSFLGARSRDHASVCG